MKDLNKNTILKVGKRSLILLLIPLIMSFLVQGFNWGFFDFVFAFFMFFIFQMIYQVFAMKLKSKYAKIILGALILSIFLIIWITLATG